MADNCATIGQLYEENEEKTREYERNTS